MSNLRSFKPSAARSDRRRRHAVAGLIGSRGKQTPRAKALYQMVEEVAETGRYTCPGCGATATEQMDGEVHRVAIEHEDGCRLLRNPKPLALQPTPQPAPAQTKTSARKSPKRPKRKRS